MTNLTFEEELLEITAAYWQDMLEVTSDKEAIMLYERMADPLSKLKDRAYTEHDNLIFDAAMEYMFSEVCIVA